MPDGRWHYVFIKGELRRNTSLFSWKFLKRDFVEEEFIKNFKDFADREPTEDELEAERNSSVGFTFAFVREDLIGQLQYPLYFDPEYVKITLYIFFINIDWVVLKNSYMIYLRHGFLPILSKM